MNENRLAMMLGDRGPMDIYEDFRKKKLPPGVAGYPPVSNSLKDIFERMFFMRESQKPKMFNMTVRG